MMFVIAPPNKAYSNRPHKTGARHEAKRTLHQHRTGASEALPSSKASFDAIPACPYHCAFKPRPKPIHTTAMPLSLTIPSPGESITEVTLGSWHKADGDYVNKDDLLVEIESDKATLELLAPQAGKLSISAKSGAELPVGSVVGTIDTAAAAPAGKPATAPAAKAAAPSPASKPEAAAAKAAPARSAAPAAAAPSASAPASHPEARATSVAKKVAADHGVDLGSVHGSGPSGRIMKSDVLAASQSPASKSESESGADAATPAPANAGSARTVRREKLSKLRQRIAERLVEAQHTAAMLTTFNEVDMTEVMRLRTAHKEAFEKTHGVGLGFMSFFVTAAASALRKYPRVNAYIVSDDNGRPSEIEYHDFIDIAVAVGTDRGLVVPVLRNAGERSFAQIELGIKELALKARDGKLTVDEMTGGTFTISNGGVYGSLMSTPILNPPQSAILGMHAIKNRTVEDAKNAGHVVLRPMMYLALSYDHRIIDGAEAVGFLVHIKNCIESPERLLLGV
jgi:2-oxoglutarate dehydrogenase E2 component (dihydrolipoamide succinyltransferase)